MFSKSSLVLLSLFVLVSVALAADNRKCYECQGKEDCKKPRKQECQSYVKGCAKATSDSAPFVAKGCADNGKGGDMELNGCVKIPYAGAQMSVCECQKDYCNSASTFSTTFVVLTTGAFLLGAKLLKF